MTLIQTTIISQLPSKNVLLLITRERPGAHLNLLGSKLSFLHHRTIDQRRIIRIDQSLSRASFVDIGRFNVFAPRWILRQANALLLAINARSGVEHVNTLLLYLILRASPMLVGLRRTKINPPSFSCALSLDSFTSLVGYLVVRFSCYEIEVNF